MARVRRRRTDEASQRASTLELFYDLVFVFAITEIFHMLLEPLTWAGAHRASRRVVVVELHDLHY